MTQGSVRLGVAAVVLILLWIAVYWWTPAAPSFEVAFEGPRPTSALPPEPPAGLSPTPEQSTPSLPPVKETPKAQPAVIPPSFVMYTVQDGDTAERIARKIYGTPEYWQSVMQANPTTDFQRLKAGRVIRVPKDPKNIQGVPSTVRQTGAPTPPAPPEVPAAEDAPQQSGGIEYLVQPGDTLTEIAARFYGRASAWTLIRDANREKLGADGKKLRSGMKIKLPAAPDGAKP